MLTNIEVGGDKPDSISYSAEKNTKIINEQTNDSNIHSSACRSIQNFSFIGQIGEGTYGEVYQCLDLTNNRNPVALKRVKLHNENNDGFPLTSIREITALKTVAGHPHCVSLLDIAVGIRRDDVYLVFEYCEHDLESLARQHKVPFTEADIKTIVMQLLSGLEHMHSLYLIHRDIKLSNLLLDRYGNLKLADFGLARVESDSKQMTPRVASLWYRPPELLLGATMYDSKIDLWAVGCVFGDLLIHAPLFPGRSELDQLSKIFDVLGCPSERIWPGLSTLPLVRDKLIDLLLVKQRNEFNNLSVILPNLCQEGVDLLNRLLTYNPDRRISAQEAHNDNYFRISPLPTMPELMPTFPSSFVTRPALAPGVVLSASANLSKTSFISNFNSKSSTDDTVSNYQSSSDNKMRKRRLNS